MNRSNNNPFISFRLIWSGVLLFLCSCAPPAQKVETIEGGYYLPWESLDELFHEVQMSGIFTDSKTFVDCVPKSRPSDILQAYRSSVGKDGFDLNAFVIENFELPSNTQVEVNTNKPFREHLEAQWENLTRHSTASPTYTTLINLPYQYIVPGGRFREVYYWDSYFSMIGLGVSGREDLVRSMVDNFAFLIDSVGFIPNGNRTYYLGRSQPPYFSLMVNLLMQLTNNESGITYLDQLRREYDFWMNGASELSSEGMAVQRVVRLSDGVILNRYWDTHDFPRPESYKPDVELAEGLPEEEKRELYRNLRAAAESGWDFSTRWFADGNNFTSIKTTEILPVDLNCLMYHLEKLLSELYLTTGQREEAKKFQSLAEHRKQAIQRYFWDQEEMAFTDYWWTEDRLSDQFTLAGAYPLYFTLASETQAEGQADRMREKLLAPGGLLTTSINSGQQWDAPNGWAPLQWIAIKGLEKYELGQLAHELASRWLEVNEKVYRNTGKMMEKYNVVDTTLIAGGGEYPTQDGFGWTNGVALGLLEREAAY